jgi:fucose permease
MDPAPPAPVPPVVDVPRQVRIETALKEANAKSLFSPFNIAAVLIFLLVVFFLYKRYRDKRATEQAHGPSPVIPPPRKTE